MSDKRFGKFGMLELPLGVQSVIDHPVQPFIKNQFGIRGNLNMGCFSFTGSNYASISALSTNILGGQGDFTVSAMGKSTDSMWFLLSDCSRFTVTRQINLD